VPEVVELMSGYKRLLMDTRPTQGDDVIYNVIVVVFTDWSADRAHGVFDDVLKHLAVPSYVEDGILFGPYYERQEGDCDLQLELPTIPVARAVSVREAWSHQRLEVLPGRGVAQLVGARPLGALRLPDPDGVNRGFESPHSRAIDLRTNRTPHRQSFIAVISRRHRSSGNTRDC
jgi:hypothetical protein